jgi:hypothetical protein
MLGANLVCYATSRSFKESGKCDSLIASYIYVKNGKYFSKIYVKRRKYFSKTEGKFLPVEESPFWGDTSLGELGEYRYRYKNTYVNTKYCPQGWNFFYFNLPSKSAKIYPDFYLPDNFDWMELKEWETKLNNKT